SGIIFEAMASGMPVIASKIPCIPDQVEDGKTGILCRQDDVEAFANAANMLVKDGKKRKLMGRRGHEKIKAFAWNRIINNRIQLEG
ncbi:MAG: glycosyltransferase, partial [Candidatus Nanoarchaeia archaeon]